MPPHVPSVEVLAVDEAAALEVLVDVVEALMGVDDVAAFVDVLEALLETTLDTPPAVQVPNEAWQAVLQ